MAFLFEKRVALPGAEAKAQQERERGDGRSGYADGVEGVDPFRPCSPEIHHP